jgi:hypothetical protein
MAAARAFSLTLSDASGAVLDEACAARVGPEGLALSGNAASSALGTLGWNTLLRVRTSTRAPARHAARAAHTHAPSHTHTLLTRDDRARSGRA